MNMNKDNAQFRAVFDTAIDGIIIIDAGGVIMDANQAALDLFKYEHDEVVGKNSQLTLTEFVIVSHLQIGTMQAGSEKSC